MYFLEMHVLWQMAFDTNELWVNGGKKDNSFIPLDKQLLHCIKVVF